MTGLALARLRYQPGQAVVVALLSGMLALTAVLGLAYARAVEESVQRTVLTTAPVAQRGVTVSTDAARPPAPTEMRSRLSSALDRPSWQHAVAGASATGLLDTTPRVGLVPLLVRDDVCAHLRITEGRCDLRTGHVVLARSVAERAKVDVGGRVSFADASGGSAGHPVLRNLTVSGIYQGVDTSSTYWFGRTLTATVPGEGAVDGLDAAFVDWTTLRVGAWRSLQVSVDVPLAVKAVTLDTLPRTRRDVQAVSQAASAASWSAATQLPDVIERADAQRALARAPLPLLGVQAVLLALVVLAYVAAASTEQRRAEVALARLRGQQPATAAQMLVRDLALVVLLGCLAGAVLGWVTARLAADRWLEPGIVMPVTWPLAAAFGGCVVLALGAVLATAVPTVREPLVSLLRTVPPRGDALRAGVVDGVVLALCVAGLVTVLTGDASSPNALLAPGLVVVAGALVLSQMLVPAAAVVGRRLLRRGRLRGGLAATAVARRPALRRLVAIETVAVGLLVYAAAAGAVATEQRTDAARQQVGAPVTLTVTAADPYSLRRAVSSADPDGRFAAPVVLARSSSGSGPWTLVSDPARLAAVAFWQQGSDVGAGAPKDLAPLAPRRPAPVEVRGSRLSAQVRFQATAIETDPDEWFDPTGSPPPQGLQGPARLQVVLVDTHGQRVTADLGVLTSGAQTRSGAVPCADGCRLQQVVVSRGDGDNGAAGLNLEVRRLLADDRPVDLRSRDGGWRADTFGMTPSTLDGRQGLHSTARAVGTSLWLTRRDVPTIPPALVTSQVPQARTWLPTELDPRNVVQAPSISGADGSFEKVGDLKALPLAGRPGVLASIADAGVVDGTLSATTSSQVWLAADDPEQEAALVRALRGQGVDVLQRDSVTGRARALAGQPAGLSLRLTSLVGLVSLLLGVAVLAVSVVTSGRVRALDLAGLRLVGVPARVLRAAAVREQLIVVALGTVGGGALGAAGAFLGLAHVAADPGLPLARLAVAWPSIGVAVLAAAVLLGGVCSVLGRRLARRADPSVLREGQQ